MTFYDYIKKFLIFIFKEISSFIIKMILLIITLIILGMGLIYTGLKYDRKLSYKDTNYSYVIFNPSDITEDKVIENSFLDIFTTNNKYNITFSDILYSLDDIKNNNSIKGIIINLDEIQLSSSQRDEFIEKFEEIKKSGKKIYAIGAYIDNSNYTLATIADEIITYPTASAGITLSGYHYSSLYYKNLLDKLGINVEVVRIGDYKSYGENYISNEMSSELREELTRIFDNRFNKFVENVAKKRNIDKEKLTKDILEGNNVNLSPFSARDKNLVDKLKYFDEFLAENNIQEDEIVDIYEYYSNNKNKIIDLVEKKGSETIAVIYAEGGILYENSEEGVGSITPKNIAQKISKLSEIENLKGVVLRVNSPGGSALASEMIYQMLKKIEVPVYVSMGDIAASGGYYMSMVGNKIFADESTITGSIGVVSMIPKFYNTQSKYGIKSNIISKGKYSGMYDNFSPITREDKNKITESMMNTYREFKSRVISNRNISDEVLENYAQGKIWLGDEAKEIKLIDEIGSLDKTIKTMAKDLKLEENSYNIKNIYTEYDIFETFKSFKTYILSNFYLLSDLIKIYNRKKILEKYEIIKNNSNVPMYYFPYEIKF